MGSLKSKEERHYLQEHIVEKDTQGIGRERGLSNRKGNFKRRRKKKHMHACVSGAKDKMIAKRTTAISGDRAGSRFIKEKDGWFNGYGPSYLSRSWTSWAQAGGRDAKDPTTCEERPTGAS